jgi:hypothetical protein
MAQTARDIVRAFDADTILLFKMAHMYANRCTRQEEKFRDFQRRGCTWRWEDCKAAWDIVHDQFKDRYWAIFEELSYRMTFAPDFWK